MKAQKRLQTGRINDSRGDYRHLGASWRHRHLGVNSPALLSGLLVL